MASTIVVGLIIYLFVLNESEHNHEMSNLKMIYKLFIGPISDLKWEHFKDDCGYHAFLNGPQSSI
jgi:hypothetical protein